MERQVQQQENQQQLAQVIIQSQQAANSCTDGFNLENEPKITINTLPCLHS